MENKISNILMSYNAHIYTEQDVCDAIEEQQNDDLKLTTNILYKLERNSINTTKILKLFFFDESKIVDFIFNIINANFKYYFSPTTINSIRQILCTDYPSEQISDKITQKIMDGLDSHEDTIYVINKSIDINLQFKLNIDMSKIISYVVTNNLLSNLNSHRMPSSNKICMDYATTQQVLLPCIKNNIKLEDLIIIFICCGKIQFAHILKLLHSCKFILSVEKIMEILVKCGKIYKYAIEHTNILELFLQAEDVPTKKHVMDLFLMKNIMYSQDIFFSKLFTSLDELKFTHEYYLAYILLVSDKKIPATLQYTDPIWRTKGQFNKMERLRVMCKKGKFENIKKHAIKHKLYIDMFCLYFACNNKNDEFLQDLQNEGLDIANLKFPSICKIRNAKQILENEIIFEDYSKCLFTFEE